MPMNVKFPRRRSPVASGPSPHGRAACHTTPVTPDPLLTDILLPSAAILISTLIALLVVGVQLRAAKLERRSEAVARVTEAISHLIADCSRVRRGEDFDLEPAMAALDATVIQWKLAERPRSRVVAASVRDTLFLVYLNDPEKLESAGWMMRSYLEQWALGNIPTREFRRYAAWGGAAWPWRQRTITGAWGLLRERTGASHRPDDPELPRTLSALEANGSRVPIAEKLDKARDRIFVWWYRR